MDFFPGNPGGFPGNPPPGFPGNPPQNFPGNPPPNPDARAQAEAAQQAARIAQLEQNFRDAQGRINQQNLELKINKEHILSLTKRDLSLSFAHSREWVFEKFLGNGTYGVTALLRDRDPLSNRHHKRVVLKRSLAVQGNKDLLNEIIMLKLMRGNAHHAQIITSTDDVANYRRKPRPMVIRVMRRFLDLFQIGLFSNPPKNVFRTLSISDGPALLMEYLEGGDLLHMMERQNRLNLRLPNRILWSFFLCLVRASVGLSYPKQGGVDAPQELEEVKGEEKGILHGDLFPRNIMIGSVENDVPEHVTIPRLKLIDFGMAVEASGGRQAIAAARNNLSVAELMITLITRNPFVFDLKFTGEYEGILTGATPIISAGAPYGGALPFPRLDRDLRLLLVECLNVVEADRPPMDQLLRRARLGAAKPVSAYPILDIEESDRYINETLTRLVYAPEEI
ncbi:kinase-like domain-containing protein [Nemania abortiva]|nr:kinase-like domain-containing protein [Nemania abortiva]